ncbi:MAG: pyridoxal phosphate-dependent aminotransferase [Candidatus Saliniplasma sp.]
MRGSERVEGLTESVIREMTRKAIKYDAINLSQGYPEYPMHDKIKESAIQAIERGRGENQYSITWGKRELREKLSEKLKNFNDIEYDPEKEITITCGASESIMSTMLGLINEGDEVIIFQPFYENYVPSVTMASGKPVFNTIQNDMSLDFEGIKNSVNKNTKMILLNTPHNPTGKVFSKKELEFLRDLCVDYDVIAVTDEMYEHIVFEGKHISLASTDNMWDRTITISGFSKAYSVTGWRVGYSAAPNSLMKSIRKAHDYTTVCSPTPFQTAVIKGLELPDSYYRNMVNYYQKARDFVYEKLSESELEPSLPYGAYYMMASLENIDMNDVEYADYLVKEKGVAVVPGTSFYEYGGKDMVRFCFSQKMDDLSKAMDRILG